MKTLKEFLLESEIPDMIEHNGKMVHTRNSEGRLIHHTVEGIKNFHNWFEDSKVTDEHGRPKVMYHGTHSDFNSFKPGSEKVANAIYFTPNQSHAGDWAQRNSGNILRTYIKANNIFDYDNNEHISKFKSYSNFDENIKGNKRMLGGLEAGSFTTIERPIVQDFIKANNFDAFHINEFGKEYKTPKNIAAFHPSQIKSAIGNKGTFSKHSDNITENFIYE